MQMMHLERHSIGYNTPLGSRTIAIVSEANFCSNHASYLSIL